MAEGVVDFDPLTKEGQADINETINDDYENLIPSENESGVSWVSRIKQKFGDNYEYAVGLSEICSN